MKPSRTYWCHVDVSTGFLPLPGGRTTVSPRTAVEWVREAARAIGPELDRESFHRVWAWLGDHPAARDAVAALHRGEPFHFSVTASSCRWMWSAHPVIELPLADPRGCLPLDPSRVLPVTPVRERRSAGALFLHVPVPGAFA